MKYRYLIYISLLSFVIACKPELDEFEISSGNANFTTYVSLGNSLTAGYADGALYPSGQEYSYTNILAEQFQKVGGGSFGIPMMPNERGIGILLIPEPPFFRLESKLILGYSSDCLGQQSMGPQRLVENPDQLQLYAELTSPVDGPINNFGVYGAKAAHLLAPGYGDPAGLLNLPPTANPFYVRFASSTVSSIIFDAIATQPTFYTLWIGNNDVLQYALSGGIGDTITSQGFYAFVMNTIITSMNATGAEGAIANVPSVTSIPFFNTVPFNALPLQEQAQVDALNAGYAAYNQLMETNGLPYRINFTLGYNPLVIMDEGMPLPPEYAQYKFRQITEDELLLLSIPQDSIKCAGWGSQVPVGSQYVLTEGELANIDDAIVGYNQTIEDLALQYDLAYIDMNAELIKLEDGITQDGITLTADFVTGNGFSLDGVHLTPMGNAHVANMFINGINAKFDANLPLVSIAEYPSVELP